MATLRWPDPPRPRMPTKESKLTSTQFVRNGRSKVCSLGEPILLWNTLHTLTGRPSLNWPWPQISWTNNMNSRCKPTHFWPKQLHFWHRRSTCNSHLLTKCWKSNMLESNRSLTFWCRNIRNKQSTWTICRKNWHLETHPQPFATHNKCSTKWTRMLQAT